MGTANLWSIWIYVLLIQHYGPQEILEFIKTLILQGYFCFLI